MPHCLWFWTATRLSVKSLDVLCRVCAHFRCAEVFATFLLGGIVSGADAGARQLSLALLGQIDIQPSFGSLICRCLDLMRAGNMLNGCVACG